MLGCYGKSMFNFLRNFLSVFQSGFTTLHSSESQFLHNLSNICYCLSFYYGLPSGCEVVSHGGFNLHFLMTNDVEHLFMCMLALFISALEISLSRSFVGETFSP